MTYQKSASQMPPAYWDCPGWCPEERAAKETPCRQCPAEAQEREMLRELEHTLDERVGPRWRDWGLEGLMRHVYETAHISEGDPSGWTVTAAKMVGIYKGQQARIQRIDDWNRRQAQKGRANG